ncbi:IclR family transcriptional regulator [Ramlibacter sp. MAHUQ-53]|uniref:IclR family transcriptional regulator n=1 Tax=unclassified Ramlibacter TaxID=2617605 RepID=UPI0036409363
MIEAPVFELQALEGSAPGPRAILRVMQVLGHLAEHPQGRTLGQLCEALGVPKTTLFTMLRTLQGSGHLEVASGVYRLGPLAVALGAAMAASARRNFPECARESLQSLSRRTGETSFLAVLTADGMNCRYVSVIESGNWLRFSVLPDSLKPSYATGTGHAMLAYLPPAEVEAILERVHFEKLTRKTVGSRKALLAALARVREEQVSVTDSGTVAEVMSVAAPIFDASGRVMAAVSAGGPAARMAPHLSSIRRMVRGTAEDISRTLGLVGDWPPA